MLSIRILRPHTAFNLTRQITLQRLNTFQNVNAIFRMPMAARCFSSTPQLDEDKLPEEIEP